MPTSSAEPVQGRGHERAGRQPIPTRSASCFQLDTTSATGTINNPATPAEEAFDLLGGMMVAAHAAGLVALGLRLGLYRAMAGQGPLTSKEVAERAGLRERWVREWLHAQLSRPTAAHTRRPESWSTTTVKYSAPGDS
jgi:hypothetical protein